jgi:polyketide biosynthesis enoyl-CoA hydratase PksH
MTTGPLVVGSGHDGASLRLRLALPETGNTLTAELVGGLHAALDRAEGDPACRVVVLEGMNGVFCTGMDFERLLAGAAGDGAGRFADLLRRFATGPRVVVSAVDGKVMAGGLGLLAASDLVYVTERSTFALSEALWGLLPSVVAPYLIRRVGFRLVHEMTLTARTVTAAEASRAGLADALVADLTAHLDLQVRRLRRLDPATVVDLKAYYHKLWPISEETERAALDELNRLLGSERVRRNVETYVRYGRMPWES